MARRKLVNPRSLMQPFLPGSPGGRGGRGSAKGDGEAKRIPDDRWASAFPECKHNKNLGGDAEWTYEEYMKKKMGLVEDAPEVKPEDIKMGPDEYDGIIFHDPSC